MTQDNKSQPLESLESLRETLGNQNTKVSACTEWTQVSPDFILSTFATPAPECVSDDDIRQRVFDMFCAEVDPLSAEGLQDRFPNFPPEWYAFMAQAARDRFDVVPEKVPKEKTTTTTQGKFKICFN